MSFKDSIANLDWESTRASIYAKSKADVENALRKSKRDLEDFKALISPAAEPYLEQMAQLSHSLTQKRFGKTIQMYIPLYLSNECQNICTYCGFSLNVDIPRKTLTDEEILEEVKVIKSMGYDHVLLVTGEANKTVGLDYFKNAIRLIKPHFSHISIEVQPMSQEDYEALIAEGLNTVLVYQETYNKEDYKKHHPKGKKSNLIFVWKRMIDWEKQEFTKWDWGVLIGLEDWRTDSFFCASHLDYLERTYWKSKYSISFPRLRPCAGGVDLKSVMTDRQLVQLICAYRIFNEEVELSMSTRESETFRDHVIRLGITSVSADSKTDPGGYANPDVNLEQFEIDDDRATDEFAGVIRKQGYEPVFKTGMQYSNDMLNKEEIARYSRHIKIDSVGKVGQEKLKAAKVLVIGAGGLGCPVLQYLTAAGVGMIALVDDDVVDASNLQRQILFNVDDIGKSKVEQAIRTLSKQNPYVEFVAYPERLTSENACAIMEPYDIVIDGTDNFPTRYLVNDACLLMNKPLVFGSIYKFEGQVSVFNYQNGPSYRCLYPNPPKPGEVPNCSEIGVIGILPGVVGTHMASECIKMILGLGDVLSGRLQLIDILGNKNMILSVKRNNENFERTKLEDDYADFCGIEEPKPFEDSITAEELNKRLKEGEKIRLVDVREIYEQEICLIQDSQCIPLGEIPHRKEEISQEVPTVMICHHGMRSASAIEYRKEQGFENLINLEGGIHAWALNVDNEMITY